jgi:hypothetical protein
MSLLGLIGQMQDPALLGLLGAVPTLWESDSASTLPVTDNTANDPTAAGNSADLIGPGLPISKSGTPYFPLPPPPYFPPPPQLSPSAPQWLDVARWVTPGLVDYFTKPAPPPAPFPSTPGKIPPVDANPYFGPAIVDAVNVGTAVLGAGEGVALGLARLAASGGPELAAGRALSVAQQLAAKRAAQLAPNIAGFGERYSEGVGGTALPALDRAVNRIPAQSSASLAPPEQFPQGSFSISNWAGYPEFPPAPRGPFRLLEANEYEAARRAANRANRLLRDSDPLVYLGKEVHEIHPVKFGGDPIDPSNKIVLTKQNHRVVNSWWYQRQRDLRQ